MHIMSVLYFIYNVVFKGNMICDGPYRALSATQPSQLVVVKWWFTLNNAS